MKRKVTGQEDIDWINLAQNSGQWQAVVSKERTICIIKNWDIFFE
jgi:hypothetical protein